MATDAPLSIRQLLLLAVCVVLAEAQQSYVNNHQLDCYNQAFNSTTLGYVCNGIRSSCQSYLTFRSTANYSSPALIGYLLGASQSAALIASINNITSDTASVPTDSLLVVPVDCSCFSRQYYQHNATYLIKDTGETYFTVANNTYQGLTTCQALMDQNPFGDRDLLEGMSLSVPLRCACPTANQTSSGVKYLLCYMVTWGDSFASIANLFGVDQQSLLDANELSSTSTIFPFTPILVPLTTEATKIRTPSAVSPPAAPPPLIPISPVGRSPGSSNNESVFVGVGVGAAVLVLFAVSGFLFCWYRKSHGHNPISTLEPKTLPSSDSVEIVGPPDTSKSWSLSSHGIRSAIESLTVYKFKDLQIATAYFDQANRIKGSVYKGSFNCDAAAVKVMKGDVSSEINILKMLNHSSIIRLSGFCVHEGNTYLVCEYADNGSLSDWLTVYRNKYGQALSWQQRVQIAYDVADALNYLHNYTNPPHIHKNLKTSNILLDANLRAKVANFGLARIVEKEDGDGLQLTRHVVGTQGYMAPEYIENGFISPKLDVFAYGVVILVLLSGKEAAADKNAGDELLSAIIWRVLEGDNVREKLLGFLDPSLKDGYPLDLVFSMAQLAKSCVSHDPNARPSMSQVLVTLSKVHSSSLDWDPSDDIQNSRSFSHGRWMTN